MPLNPQNLGPGQEQHEIYTTTVRRKKIKMCQYDYRHKDGELFSCVALTLELAREKRDVWLKRHEGKKECSTTTQLLAAR